MSVYSDIDLTMQVHPVNLDLNVLYDANAIKRAIKHVLLMRKGDVKFHPERVIGVTDLLFEPLTPMMADVLAVQIRQIINSTMPRVKLKNVNVEINTQEDGFDVELTFAMVNILTETTVQLFLERIR